MNEDWDESLRVLVELGAVGTRLTERYRESDQAFLLALREVVELGGGIGVLASTSGLNRENLYRTLSAAGNPKLSSLRAILDALGLQMRFEASQAPGVVPSTANARGAVEVLASRNRQGPTSVGATAASTARARGRDVR